MYVYADDWFSGDLCPQEGETYGTFIARVTPAMKALRPEMSDELIQNKAESAWAKYMLATATEATVRIKRDFYPGSVYYGGGWWDDWQILEVLTAKTATVSFTSVEKARAGKGDAVKVAKTADDKQLVFGWANVAKDANGKYPLDWDGDVTNPEDLEAAAYSFVLKHRATGEQHQGDVKGQLVESIMFTKEKQEALGIPDGVLPEGWWVGFHIEDKEVFAKIKSGEYEMFSVQGDAYRVPTGM